MWTIQVCDTIGSVFHNRLERNHAGTYVLYTVRQLIVNTVSPKVSGMTPRVLNKLVLGPVSLTKT